MKLKVKECCMCGKPIVGFGNNPAPLNNRKGAKCCDECNQLVILERLYQEGTKRRKK